MCFSVPDILGAVNRLNSLGVELIMVSPKHDIAVARDPDGYAIQLICQDVDKHEELAEVCREVVSEGAKQARKEITQSNDPETLEEAGMKPSGHKQATLQ